MRTITATEASRSFAALLDDVERGQTVIVTRAGRRIACISPASAANGNAVLSLLASRELDDGFAGDVRAARDSVTAQEPAWPTG